MNTDAAWQTHELTVDRQADATGLLDREWLLTNGTGAYAAGTALGCPTRRYHGLLIGATRPPVGRLVLLNQMWEQLLLRVPGDTIQQSLEFATLSFHSPQGSRVFAPQGHAMLESFQRGLTVRWRYRWGKVTFDRELLLHWQAQAATIRYRITGLDAAATRATLRLRPMVTLRDYHSVLHRAASGAVQVEADRHRLTLRRDGAAVTFAVHRLGGASQLAPLPPGQNDVRFVPDEHWWYDVHYPLDRERGQEDREDYFVPGGFELALDAAPRHEIALTVALGSVPVLPQLAPQQRAAHLEPVAQRLAERISGPGSGVWGRGANRSSPTRSDAPDPRPQTPDPAHALALASDDFIVQRTLRNGEEVQTLSTILAGYPWFADWGRDTFIALPGLLLTTGRHAEAGAVLRVFARAIRHGLVPNRFDDYDDQAAHYNTVDASLWFIQAALLYMEAADDRDAWRQWLGAACVQIVEAYIAGTGTVEDAEGTAAAPSDAQDSPRGDLIRMDEDGLIAAGTPRTQLTWMDAAIGAPTAPERTVFTPRPGKAVEFNALWFNALQGLAEALEQSPKLTLPDEVGTRLKPDELASRYRKLAAKVKRSFGKVFWDEQRGHLVDHVWTDPQGHVHVDASFRPNQLFAISLPRSPLAQARQKLVVRQVTEKLLTPVGLRTLPQDDPAYHGRYTGDQYQRDEAYHQGTIWPWLIGPYGEAVLRSGKFSKQARTQARAALAPLRDQITGLGCGGAVGQLHEIYEADPDAQGRHRPVGCFAQAWSVAELLRVAALIESL